MKYYGWYDPNPEDTGTLALSYWNHIVNTYPSVGKDQNDLSRYTKKHYVESCRRYMDAHTKVHPDRKFFIDLPLAEVYNVGTKLADDGFKENIPVWKTLDWIEYVVRELDTDERVLGWYHADEPEVWGYREVVNGNVTNANPPIPYQFLSDRYFHIKAFSNKPVLALFCDVPLFIERFYKYTVKYTPFFDIFGFDYYPFQKLNKNINEINTKKFREFINIASNIREGMPILYVGQGSGSPEFNTRVPTLEEHQALFQEFVKYCPEDRRFGYLLWSANRQYANDNAIENGTIALSSLTQWSKLENIHSKGKVYSVLNYFKKWFKKLFRS